MIFSSNKFFIYISCICDLVRHRLPMFMREMPHDGDVTRNVKRAVTSIDKFR